MPRADSFGSLLPLCQSLSMSSAVPPPPPPGGASSQSNNPYEHFPGSGAAPATPGIPGWFWIALVGTLVVGIGGGVAIGFPLFSSSSDVGSVDYDQRVLCDQVEDLATVHVEEYEDFEMADLDAMRGVAMLGYAIEADGGDAEWAQLSDDLIDGVSMFALPPVEESLDALVDHCDAEVL